MFWPTVDLFDESGQDGPHGDHLLFRLPSEIQREILRLLDHKSIQSLIVGVPRTRRWFVLIKTVLFQSSYPFLRTGYFDVAGVPQVHTSQFKPSNFPQALIHLYDLELKSRLEPLKAQTQWLEDEAMSLMPYLNRYSFIILYELQLNKFYLDMTRRVEKRGAQFMSMMPYSSHGLQRVMGSAYQAFCVSTLERMSYLKTVDLSESLVKLHITNITKVNHLRFDTLIALTIEFDPTTSERPEIHDLDAGLLRYFSIYYYSQFPSILNVRAGVDPNPHPFDVVTKFIYSDFDLMEETSSLAFIHVPAAGAVTSPLPIIDTTVEEMIQVELRFAGNFRNIAVIGGHDCVLTKVIEERLLFHARIDSLVWKQANRQFEQRYLDMLDQSMNSIHGNRSMIVLNELCFESVLPAPCVPCQIIGKFRKLYVHLRGEGPVRKWDNLIDNLVLSTRTVLENAAPVGAGDFLVDRARMNLSYHFLIDHPESMNHPSIPLELFDQPYFLAGELRGISMDAETAAALVRMIQRNEANEDTRGSLKVSDIKIIN